MSDRVHDYEQLARSIDEMAVPVARELTAGTGVDICQVWQGARPIVDAGIKILNLLPFAWAKKLGSVLELLGKALNALCP